MMDFADFLVANQFPQVKKRAWMDERQFILGTPENLPGIIDACIESGRYAMDLETTGLDNRVFALPSGVKRTVDQIAGICLSPDGIRGCYIPIMHMAPGNDGVKVPLECNIPMTVFVKEFQRLIQATEAGKTVAVFHNGKFDQEFLQFNGTGTSWGEWDKSGTWDDTLILCYLGNSRKRDKRLKSLSKELLGIDQIQLAELFPEQYEGPMDFSTLDPQEEGVLWYGGGDAICTYLLYPKLAGAVIDADTDGKTQAGIYKIEKVCVAATRWMERNRIHIDRTKVMELVQLGQQEWFESIMDVYAEAEKILGRDVMPGVYHVLKDTFVANDVTNLLSAQITRAEAKAKGLYGHIQGKIHKNGRDWPIIYDVESPQQLGPMFEEMNVPGLKKTEKSGQVKTSKDELERVIEETGSQFPFMRKIRRFREVNKALATYLYPMLLDSDPTDDTMRINFQGHKVDTGRYSTPAKESSRDDSNRERMVGWPQVNLQALPSTADPKRPACMTRLRECITARPVPSGKPKKKLVAIDYAGVELRLVTNLSGEPKWLSEFFHCSGCDRVFDRPKRSNIDSLTPLAPPARCPNCGSDKIGDLHTLTALEIYGKDAISRPDWKVVRGHAKGTNFALCYGGGGQAVQRATGVDKNEGWRIKNQFDRTYKGLSSWWTSQHAVAKQFGYVRTAFGRKYPVPDIHSDDRGFVEKAKRNSINGPIQGTSADITKTAMALIYKEMKRRGWLDKVLMVITMHDELVFEIDLDVLEEAIQIIVHLMVENEYILSRNWPVPLTTDVEIGDDWTVPWDLNGMTYKEVRFIGNKKYKDQSKLPADQVWDQLSSWPEDLRPWFKAAQSSGDPTPDDGNTGGGGSPVVTTPQVKAPEMDTPKIPSTLMAARMATVAGHRPGEPWTYRLKTNLTILTMHRLADIIHHCRDSGTSVLHLEDANGTSLDAWAGYADVDQVRVSPNQFLWAATLAHV